MLPQDICQLLYDSKFSFNNERELQDGIAAVLLSAKREVILSPDDRIDFMLDGIGIEVKVGGPLSSITRQLWRYSLLEQVESLILVTTRTSHRGLPASMNKKDIFVVYLLNSIF